MASTDGLQKRYELDTARIDGLLNKIKELENQNIDLVKILHRAYSAIITLPTDGMGWQYTDDQRRLSIRDELLRAMNTELQKAKEKG